MLLLNKQRRGMFKISSNSYVNELSMKNEH